MTFQWIKDKPVLYFDWRNQVAALFLCIFDGIKIELEYCRSYNRDLIILTIILLSRHFHKWPCEHWASCRIVVKGGGDLWYRETLLRKLRMERNAKYMPLPSTINQDNSFFIPKSPKSEKELNCSRINTHALPPLQYLTRRVNFKILFHTFLPLPQILFGSGSQPDWHEGTWAWCSRSGGGGVKMGNLFHKKRPKSTLTGGMGE